MKRTEPIISQMRKDLPDPGGEIRALVGGLQVRLKLSDWDRLGCLLERLEIRDPRGTFGLDAARIEAKVTYLEEPLAVIEAEEGKKTILRSAPPRRNGEEVCFFEMVLDRSEGLSLVRYAFDRVRGERSITPAPLTISTLDRLLTDLLALAEN